MTVSGRSDLEAIAYSRRYGGTLSANALTGTEQSVVVSCEPDMSWMIDDSDWLVPEIFG